MAEVVWQPPPGIAERARAARLVRRAGLSSWRELVARSAREPEWFWPLAIDDLGLELSRPWDAVYDDSGGPEWTTWFPGARLSIARNCVHRWARRRPDAPAVVGFAEDGTRRELTFAELSHEVARLAEALAVLGVRRGDRVALFLPMTPEAAIASHACAHLGAIQVPLYSSFAAEAVAARLRASGAKVAITARASTRRGTPVPMRETLEEARRDAPALEHIVVAPWDDLVSGCPGRLPALEVDPETPYLLAYSSGEAGDPRGVVHVQGGFLVQVAREAAYQADLSEGDALCFLTDVGSIMGPWALVGAGAVGATVVLLEGAADVPRDRLWRAVESESVTSLGLSPTLVRTLAAQGDPDADLSSLRTFVTTGEPLGPAPYRWLYERVGGGHVPVINCSGGAAVGACLLSPVPSEPIAERSLGGPTPGTALDVVDEDGRSLVGTGEVGELVCRRPWPGMTRGLWGDPERYLDVYWRRRPGLWTHGDRASCDADGFWFLHGRSDDTLTIAGRRVGPAELEAAAASHPAVREAAAVGMPDEIEDEVAWLFCCLLPGHEGSPALAGEIAEATADTLGRPFTPARVLFVPALPRTRSAKLVRRAVRATALGADPGDLASLENPESLEQIAAAVG